MKKIFSTMFISLFILMGFSLFGISSKAAGQDEELEKIYHQIVEDVAKQDGSNDTSNYEIVELKNDTISTFSIHDNFINSKHAVQKVTEEENGFNIDTFFPYTYTEDGTLANLIDLRATKYKEIQHEHYPQINKMDVTIKCSAKYGYVYSGGYHYYAPVSTAITWTAGEKVSEMSIRFFTIGNLCDSNQNEIPGRERETHVISRSISNPTMGVTYSAENRMNGYFLRPVTFNDGGVIEFTVNGMFDAYGLFGKSGTLDPTR